jgi:isoquinoline 1-oxidoreductase beta subunit
VIWSREDDMQHDVYRPAVHNRLQAGLDAQGKVVGWHHHIVAQSILARFGPLKNGVDGTLSDGTVDDFPYTIPAVLVEQSIADLPVPVGFWRSVGASHNAFVVESFVDELAAAARQDPLAFRRALIADDRHRAVLETAARGAGWGTTLPAGRARGIAIAASFGSIVAEVAEVSVTNGTPRVHRVVCAVDCGPVVNPAIVEAQMRSAIVYGLTAAMYDAITIANGGVEQSNFPNYPMLHMDAMPVIDVHIIPSTAKMGGIGEPGTPPIAPAVCNAIFAATGKRIRKLPIGTVA